MEAIDSGMDDEFKGQIGVAKLKIIGAEGDWPATRSRLRDMAVTIKRLFNCIHGTWLSEHIKRGSGPIIAAWMEKDRAWARTPKKERSGKREICPVKCVDSDIQKAIYAGCTKRYPMVNLRPVALAMNLAIKRLKKTKASKGSYPRWMRILTDDGEFPSSSHPLPIPFDARNAPNEQPLVPPPSDKRGDKKGDYRWKLRLRLDRIPREGKTAVSTIETFLLRTWGRKCRGEEEKLWKILNGEWKLCGSNIVFRESNGEWSAHICYRQRKPERADIDEGRFAFLWASERRPWHLRIDGHNFWLGGKTGRHVRHVRRQLLVQRWGRQENYRYRSGPGKGRKRALKKTQAGRLQMRWKDFVKSLNQKVVHDTISSCIAQRCGKIVYFQPAGQFGDSRFLACAGKVPGRRDGSGWDWYQIHAMLSQKCQESGIELITKKVGDNGRGAGLQSSFEKKNGAQVKGAVEVMADSGGVGL